jgi:hypothetical protein
MKKKILGILLSFAITLSSHAQSKKPVKTGLIQDFSGVITSSGMLEGMSSFTIKDSKLGEVQFYFKTEMDDKYTIDCKVSDDFLGDIQSSNAEGKKVKVKAKSTYGRFENLSGVGAAYKKEIIWRPMEITEQ